MTLYRISELLLATLIQRYIKKIISFQERETERNFTGCQVPHFMVVLILWINLLNLFLIIKSIFLRNMELLSFATLWVNLTDDKLLIYFLSFPGK